MAITFPQSIPHLNTHRGESKVFDALKKHLTDEWTVYANVRFQQWHHYGTYDIETDFILSHPVFGLLILEVKGGIHIRFDAATQSWNSTDLQMQSHKIKNPFEQARKNKYALLHLFKHTKLKHYHESELSARTTIAYGVVFPDSSLIVGQLPAEAHKNIILFAHHLNEDCEKHIKKLMQWYNLPHQDSLNPLLDSICRETFAPMCEIKRSLKHWIEDEQQTIITLTQQQFNLLSVLQFVDKASIYGCAGSGKTLLAIEKARIESSKGKKVLLVCYNTLLGQHLNAAFTSHPLVDAHCFHTIVSHHYAIHDEDVLFNDEQLCEHIVNTPKTIYDGLIVDEAQDFSEEMMLMIHSLLKPTAFTYYFWDSSQRLTLHQQAVPPCETNLILTRNFRNTQMIFKTLTQFVGSSIALSCDGPLGRRIEVLESYPLDNETLMIERVQQLIQVLVNKDGIHAKDIAILTFKGKKKSALHRLRSSIPLILFEDKISPHAIKVDTVRRFKGLEAHVVIVVELDDTSAMIDTQLFNNLCYVAFSRAVHHCIVIPYEGLQLTLPYDQDP